MHAAGMTGVMQREDDTLPSIEEGIVLRQPLRYTGCIEPLLSCNGSAIEVDVERKSVVR